MLLASNRMTPAACLARVVLLTVAGFPPRASAQRRICLWSVVIFPLRLLAPVGFAPVFVPALARVFPLARSVEERGFRLEVTLLRELFGSPPRLWLAPIADRRPRRERVCALLFIA